MSKKRKLTPWFLAKVKPTRVGVYELDWHGDGRRNGGMGFNYWDGRQWLFGSATPEATVRELPTSIPLFNQRRRWRGLAADPAVNG